MSLSDRNLEPRLDLCNIQGSNTACQFLSLRTYLLMVRLIGTAVIDKVKAVSWAIHFQGWKNTWRMSGDTGSDFTWLDPTFTRQRPVTSTWRCREWGCEGPPTRYPEALPVSNETLKVLHQILQETGLSGDEEVEEEAVVKGDALQQKHEMAVGVVARSTSFLQQSKTIHVWALSAGRNEQHGY